MRAQLKIAEELRAISTTVTRGRGELLVAIADALEQGTTKMLEACSRTFAVGGLSRRAEAYQDSNWDPTPDIGAAHKLAAGRVMALARTTKDRRASRILQAAARCFLNARGGDAYQVMRFAAGLPIQVDYVDTDRVHRIFAKHVAPVIASETELARYVVDCLRPPILEYDQVAMAVKRGDARMGMFAALSQADIEEKLERPLARVSNDPSKLAVKVLVALGVPRAKAAAMIPRAAKPRTPPRPKKAAAPEPDGVRRTLVKRWSKLPNWLAPVAKRIQDGTIVGVSRGCATIELPSRDRIWVALEHNPTAAASALERAGIDRKSDWGRFLVAFAGVLGLCTDVRTIQEDTRRTHSWFRQVDEDCGEPRRRWSNAVIFRDQDGDAYFALPEGRWGWFDHERSTIEERGATCRAFIRWMLPRWLSAERPRAPSTRYFPALG